MSTGIAWSKSSLDTLLHGCSWQWKLKKVDGYDDPGTPATAAGTAHHAAVELHEGRRIRARHLGARLPELPSTSLDKMIDHGLSVLDVEWATIEDRPGLELHASFADTATGVEASLTNWYEHLRPHVLRYVPLYREPYFNVPHGEAAIHGYIDQINWDPITGSWVVVDDKTADHFGRWPVDGLGHETELAVYIEGVRSAVGLPVWDGQPVRMEWHVARRKLSNHARFEPSRIVSSGFDRWHGAQLREELATAEQIVESGAFEKMPDWNLCSPKWCPFHHEVGGPCDPEEPAA